MLICEANEFLNLKLCKIIHKRNLIYYFMHIHCVRKSILYIPFLVPTFAYTLPYLNKIHLIISRKFKHDKLNNVYHVSRNIKSHFYNIYTKVFDSF